MCLSKTIKQTVTKEQFFQAFGLAHTTKRNENKVLDPELAEDIWESIPRILEDTCEETQQKDPNNQTR